MGSDERVQHGPQQAGHAAVHDDGPLRVRPVQVVDQEKLRYEVGHAHHRAAEDAGDQSDQSDAAVRSWSRNMMSGTAWNTLIELDSSDQPQPIK